MRVPGESRDYRYDLVAHIRALAIVNDAG